jgi:tRNA threonylcarbamoyladenosine modification (KEOPS) complex  Pcc1 subunit
MHVKARAVVRLPFYSQKQLDAVVSALEPEVQRQIGVRSKTTVSKDALMLILTVEAEDTVALRAALNSYLRWINAEINVIDAVDKEK